MVRVTEKLSEEVNRVALWLLWGTKSNPYNFRISSIGSTDGTPNICIANCGMWPKRFG